ncbi:MAG: hypothetical protein ACRDNT_07075 [Streptosporangiaceae bacterium]
MGNFDGGFEAGGATCRGVRLVAVAATHPHISARSFSTAAQSAQQIDSGLTRRLGQQAGSLDAFGRNRHSRNMPETVPRLSIHAQVAGHTFDLRQPDVRRAISRAEPGEIRDHYVEVGGRRYPVKQALAIATGLDPSDFTSQHARSVLRRLGLSLGRLSSHPGSYVTPHGQTSAVGQHGSRSPVRERHRPQDRAEALRPYLNRWVAVQRDHVLTDGDSFSEVLAWLRQNDIKADAVFLVPDNPGELLAGLTN